MTQDNSNPENPFYSAWADSPMNKEHVPIVTEKPDVRQIDMEYPPEYNRFEHLTNPRFPGQMTAKQFVEAKRLSRGLNIPGLLAIGEYTEVISPNAFDNVKSDQVPLTMFVNGERRVIGVAQIDGNLVTGRIDQIDGAELTDVVSRNDLNGVSFGFHISSLKGNYPGATDISLDPKEK